MLKSQQVQLSWHTELYGLIPEDHVLRKIGAAVDFSFANSLFADSYCHYPSEAKSLTRQPDTYNLSMAEAGERLVQHLEKLVHQVREAVPAAKGPVLEKLRKAEKILTDDRRLQTNGISSDEDTDARVGRKSKSHMFFGYKQHMTMTDGDEIITSCTLTPGNADDGKQLSGLIEQTSRATAVDSVAGDTAYSTKANLEALQAAGVKAYIPLNPSVYTKRQIAGWLRLQQGFGRDDLPGRPCFLPAEPHRG
ncbi:MAG: transposase [Bacillota bacterium]